MFPDFIIAGAMRAGSTSLANVLHAHPHIYMTTPKEPSFFLHDPYPRDFKGPGDAWFLRQNSKTISEYAELFSQAPAGTVRGEASVSYMSVPGVAEAVRRWLPNVKVVFILRDPIMRAYSSYFYLRAQGRERRPFADALDAEKERRQRHWGPIWHYTDAGKYSTHISRWIELFGPLQIHVMIFEDLLASPWPVLKRLTDFLGVPAFDHNIALPKDNSSGEPRHPLLTRALYPPAPLRRAVSALLPDIPRIQARAFRRRVLTPSPAMPETMRRRLKAALETDVAELKKLVKQGDQWPNFSIEHEL